MTSTLEAPRNAGVTPVRVVTSEWIKFRSLHSTWWSIVAALVAAIGLGILFTYLRGNDLYSHRYLVGKGDFSNQIGLSLRGFFLAQLALGVLGVLFVTGEYSTGMIRASLSAVPRRVPVLLAKAGVFAVSLFVIALAAAFIAFLGGQAALNTHPVHFGVSLGHAGALEAVVGAALYVTGVGLMGLGLGFALRNTGAAIATLFGFILVLPLLAQALPSSWQLHVNKYLPLNAGTAIMEPNRTAAESLRPWAGMGVFALYVLAMLVAGWIVLRRRDV
ncbi:MAG: ABC transporter permease [Jatrophihabitans sp.]|uniref:ABC transporter permease n=1 Tax=Jatrophihabitans sp. TaxID=1932789 RepID=UPI003F7FD7B6